MTIATVYSTGTISVTSGATAVTGAGTNFVAAGVRAGDWLKQKNGTARARIASVASATALMLDENWPGSTLSGAAYYIEFAAAEERATGMLANVSAWIGSGGAQALAGITAAADKLFYLTGATTGAVIDFKAWARSFLGAADAAAGRTALGADNASNLTSGTVPDARLNAAAILSGEGVIVNDANTFLSGNGRAFTGYTGGMTNFPSGTVWKITARKHTARVRQWIYQDNSAVTASGYKFVRQSLDNGATWSAWEPVHETQTEMDARYAKISDIRRLLSYTKTTLPSASGLGAGHLIYVTNDVGGAIPAFSDGTSWRRVSDRAVIA